MVQQLFTGNSNGITKSVDVNAGTITTGSISINSGNGSRVAQVTISSGIINCAGDLLFSGNSANARLIFTGGGTLNIGGNLGTGGTLTPSTGTINYNGAGAQNIANYTYYNLITSGSGTKTLAFDISVNNNLSIQGSSTLATGPRQITGNGVGTLSMDAGTTLTLGSPSTTNVVNLPTFLTYSLNPTSTVVFQANVAQTVSNTPVYGNLTLSTGATATTKTATGNFTIAGNLTINNNTTLSLSTAAATWNIAGSATIDGTLNFGTNVAKTVNISGDLIDATGTINMTGAGLAHTLNLGGANNALTTFTTTSGSGSTVNYTSASAQQVFSSTSYQNLTILGWWNKNA